jgi:peptidyl-prolyl cis-trans isomerase B (cyclophilin B)
LTLPRRWAIMGVSGRGGDTTMHQRLRFGAIWLFAAAVAASSGAQDERPVVATLALAQEFFYAGDSLVVELRIQNGGPASHENPVRAALLGGFKVKPKGGEPFTAKEGHGVSEPERPKKLEPGAFYGAVLDLGRLYPQLHEPGTFEIYWGSDVMVSNMLVVTVIERYDPAADYAAEIVTDKGTIVVDLFESSAPIATQAFVDMARTGVYDGLTIHEAQRDALVAGGDPLMSPGRPRRTVQFPVELRPLPIVAGSFMLRPVNVTPLANSSTFMIALRPQPDLAGQVTVLGQVVRGLDVVRTISQVPTTVRSSRPFFKPLEDVLIRRVTIQTRREEATTPPG